MANDLIALGIKEQANPKTRLLLEAVGLWLAYEKEDSKRNQGFKILSWLVQNTDHLTAHYHVAMFKTDKPWFMRFVPGTAAELLHGILETTPTSQNQVLRGMALANLAELYRRGRGGVARDEERSRGYSLESAKLGNPEGCYLVSFNSKWLTDADLELVRSHLQTAYEAQLGKAKEPLIKVHTQQELRRRMAVPVGAAIESDVRRLLVDRAGPEVRRAPRRTHARTEIYGAMNITPENLKVERDAVLALKTESDQQGKPNAAQLRLKIEQESKSYLDVKMAKFLTLVSTVALPDESYAYLLSLLGSAEGRTALLRWMLLEEQLAKDAKKAQLQAAAKEEDQEQNLGWGDDL